MLWLLFHNIQPLYIQGQDAAETIYQSTIETPLPTVNFLIKMKQCYTISCLFLKLV